MPDRERKTDVHATVTAYASVAAAYERGRPGYPANAVAWITAMAGLGPGSAVLDLAAGTGKLTQQLTGTGARVIAVEPVAAFRAALGRLPVDIRDGSAERIPLARASVDAVAVATAFHWFDAPRALVEIRRVLRPGGTLAILWNERDPRDETQRALTALLEPHRHDEPRQSDEAWLTAFAGQTAFEPLRKRDFFHHHSFTVETLVERVKSISFVAALSDETRASLLEEVRELARRRGQAFALPHLTHVYLARRSHQADA